MSESLIKKLESELRQLEGDKMTLEREMQRTSGLGVAAGERIHKNIHLENKIKRLKSELAEISPEWRKISESEKSSEFYSEYVSYISYMGRAQRDRDVGDLKKYADVFDMMGSYKEAREMAKKCRQIASDIEAERSEAYNRRLAAKANKNKMLTRCILLSIAVSIIFSIISIAVVSNAEIAYSTDRLTIMLLVAVPISMHYIGLLIMKLRGGEFATFLTCCPIGIHIIAFLMAIFIYGIPELALPLVGLIAFNTASSFIAYKLWN